MFTKIGTTIHSKIYIQINSQTNISRVMIGSANYSNRAFSNNNQFEELLVFDSEYNEKITQYYLDRYYYIKENTLDFVSNINYVISTLFNALLYNSSFILYILI